MSLWDKVDQAEATKSTGAILPEGTYTAQITDVTVKDVTFPEAVEFSVEYSITDEGYQNRKCWLNGHIDDETSAKKVSFLKGQICKMAGVDSTNGNPMETLIGAKGNTVLIDIKHRAGIKDPSKTYANVYVNEKIG